MLGAQVETREEFGQLDEPLGLLSLLGRELPAIVLAVEQILESRLHGRRQPEVRQFCWDLNGLRHGSLSWWINEPTICKYCSTGARYGRGEA